MALSLAILMIGCSDTERNTELAGGSAPSTAAQSPDGPVVRAAETADGEGVVLFIGTSLTAGLGLPEEQSFPYVVQEMIDEADLPFRVVNAGVSGETSAGALRRVDWLMQQPFDVVVLETGANDMLRGTDPAYAAENIQTIVDRIRAVEADAPIVLAGMLALPNLGPDYARDFEAIYPRLAEENDLELIPFILEGVAGERDLNQGDGVHPTAEGQRIVAANVWETLEEVLRTEAASISE
jgi:acyl-CoA thioesterase I